ncbi:site-2 protease family protein [Geomesophilobacter sediminis]|uniref:Site-2 protease family protein n=1 Tax=Geomesophilobacter sediminis TaxID=2798584 RepID=A0A8J7S8F8_9BACT|nr:site-2 protease family protein [Geomesophilobacter sediminis]MBJ6727537.1 site-2 protease family protein [Geomesophilobacter sediminis]
MQPFFFKVSVMLVPGLLAITCHEVSHGFVADKFGDNTARNLGRLTLNPLKHLDIVGTLMIFIVHIGWAKPVPVNFNNLRNPKRDMIWVAAAGPITNFVLATVSAFALRLMAQLTVPDGSLLVEILNPITLMLAFSVYINLLLAIFNLIPVPPLDGGRVAVGILPYRMSYALARVEPVGMILIILLVFFTDVFSYVISPLLVYGVGFVAGPQAKLVFDVTRILMM